MPLYLRDRIWTDIKVKSEFDKFVYLNHMLHNTQYFKHPDFQQST